MTRLRVLAVLPAAAGICVVELVHSGLAAPVVFGVKQWLAALRRDPAGREDDWPA